MAEHSELQASVNSIKRADPYVKTILATASQVALYKFDVCHNKWEKADKEGVLFLYSRTGEPYNSLMILNRLNNENYIEPIFKEFDHQMQLPFLLYRNCKSKIFGIWFFNKDECVQVAELINSIMELDIKQDKFKSYDKRINGKGTIDIFSMLTKAQEDFNRTPTKQDQLLSALASTPRVPDGASQSVVDFFAKASTKSAQKTPVSSENVLHRIMSNPVHSVEHIEKQQRSTTPQELIRLENNEGSNRRSVPINLPSTSLAHNKIDNYEIEGLNAQSLSPPKPLMTTSPLAYLMQKAPSSSQVEETVDLGTSPFVQFLETSHKPLLMTPKMFSTPTTATTIRNQEQFETTTRDIEMLTEKQLAQALIYLLKNNSDFIKQIHQAYTNSILEKVDKSIDKNKI